MCSNLSCSNSSEDFNDATSDESHEHTLLKQCKLLAKGVYGLPEAIASIHSLKTKLAALTEDRAGLYTLRLPWENILHCYDIRTANTWPMPIEQHVCAFAQLQSKLSHLTSASSRRVPERQECFRLLKANIVNIAMQRLLPAVVRCTNYFKVTLRADGAHAHNDMRSGRLVK